MSKLLIRFNCSVVVYLCPVLTLPNSANIWPVFLSCLKLNAFTVVILQVMVVSEFAFIFRVLFTYLKELFHQVKVAPDAFESFARDFIRLEKFLDEAHRKEVESLGILHLQGEVDDLRGQLSKLAKTLTEVEWKRGALRDYFYNFRNRKRLSEEMKLLNLRLLELKQSIETFGLKHCLETKVSKVNDEKMKQILQKTESRDILLSHLRKAIESTCCWELCGPCQCLPCCSSSSPAPPHPR